MLLNVKNCCQTTTVLFLFSKRLYEALALTRPRQVGTDDAVALGDVIGIDLALIPLVSLDLVGIAGDRLARVF